jgi:hypothetical protein
MRTSLICEKKIRLGPGAVCLKLDAQATYGVGFGRSIYVWNQNFIRLPMAPSSGTRISSKLMEIIETSGHPESIKEQRQHLLGRWPVYHVGAR